MSQTVKERFVSRVLTSTSSTDDNGFVKYYIVRDTMPFPVSHVFLDSTVVDEKKIWNWTQVFRKTAYDLYLQ